MRDFKTTEEIPIPPKLIDQVIGQEASVKIVKKAASQKRNVLMIGPPGIGKSMLAQAMAELMPATDMEDVLVYPNERDENKPLVKILKTYPSQDEIRKNPYLRALYARLEEFKKLTATLRAQQPQKDEETPFPIRKEDNEPGLGRLTIDSSRARPVSAMAGASSGLLFLLMIMAVIIFLYATNSFNNDNKWFVLAAILGAGVFFLLWRFTNTVGKRMGFSADTNEPKLIVDNTGRKTAPFIDASGSKAGSLLGDVKHDPLQSGGLGTPAHLRVESGAIHRANKGVLFIDEIAALKMHSQQELLTAMQEKKYPITGQSEMSSGAIVKTEPVPCDFVLVAAGNIVDMPRMHPALRSRIRGNGYEIYMDDTMPDTPENEDKLVQFVAQEVAKDKKIPHFTREAVLALINDARRKAGRKKRLTLNLRELGGLVRAAGDVAREENAKYVTPEHLQKARLVSQTLEHQLSTKYVENRKDYRIFSTEGYATGKVNGLAVLGEGASSGLVMPIVAEVTPASSKSEGKLIATGKLGAIAKEAVENVSAIIKKHMGRDVSQYDVHVQFLQTYEGVEGDSASISIAVAVLSAMENVRVRQDFAMTGSLSVRGEVLPVGGVTAKTEAAIEAGMKDIIVPASNADDIFLPTHLRSKIKIHPVSRIDEVLSLVLEECEKKDAIIKDVAGVQNGKPHPTKKARKKRKR
ncbi:Archaeal Lon protease [Candidatus Anstonella stagnisolia]|nr:Archaeal Lon protease [Candidatus Anstonella stagnisolia]